MFSCLVVLVFSLTLLSYQFTISIIWVIFLLVNRQRVFLRFNSVLLHSIFPVCLQFFFVLDPSFFFVFSQTVFVCVFLFQHFEKWNWNVVSVRTWTRTWKGEKQMRNVFSPTRHSDTSKDKSILQKCFFENMKTVSSTIFYVICCGWSLQRLSCSLKNNTFMFRFIVIFHLCIFK